MNISRLPPASSTARNAILAFGLLLCTSASAGDLSRLFYTADERARLDLARGVGEACVEYNGEISKSGVLLARWLNGHAVSSDDAASTGLQSGLGLRPGERFEIASFGIRDAYLARTCPR